MKVVINEFNIIKNVFDGNPNCIPIENNDTVIEVSCFFQGRAGDNIKMFHSETFELRNAEELVSEGYIILAEDEKIDNHKVVKLSEEEKAVKGLISFSDYLATLKELTINNISKRCYSERVKILDDVKIMNILSGATAGYPVYLTPVNVAKFIEVYKTIYHSSAKAIKLAATIEEVKNIMDSVKFPTEEGIIIEIQK